MRFSINSNRWLKFSRWLSILIQWVCWTRPQEARQGWGLKWKPWDSWISGREAEARSCTLKKKILDEIVSQIDPNPSACTCRVRPWVGCLGARPIHSGKMLVPRAGRRAGKDEGRDCLSSIQGFVSVHWRVSWRVKFCGRKEGWMNLSSILQRSQASVRGLGCWMRI